MIDWLTRPLIGWAVDEYAEEGGAAEHERDADDVSQFIGEFIWRRFASAATLSDAADPHEPAVVPLSHHSRPVNVTARWTRTGWRVSAALKELSFTSACWYHFVRVKLNLNGQTLIFLIINWPNFVFIGWSRIFRPLNLMKHCTPSPHRKFCLEVNPTLAGRHQRNHHAAKPNWNVAPQRKSVGIKTKMLEHPRSSPPIASCPTRSRTEEHYYYYFHCRR